MATTKTEKEVKTEVKEGYVKINIPRGGQKEEPNLFVAINGKAYLIPKGKTSEVPDFVAKEIYRSQAALDKYYATSDQLLELTKQ